MMQQTKFQTLIDYYLGDMAQRGCTDDSIITNRRTLEKFALFASPADTDKDDERIMEEVTENLVEGYVHQLYNRKVRWRNHPRRDPQTGKLSPFTIRKEIRILRGFETWLDKEGFENPF